jgi:hypothetical protein
MLTRKEAAKMAMDIDGHMNDNSQGIDLSWDSIEKLVNEAYAKGATAEREACAKEAESYVTMEGYGDEIAYNIRARGQ